MSTSSDRSYELALLQMVAESYLESINVEITDDVEDALKRGNNRPGFPEERGFNRFTPIQARELTSHFQVIHQASDNPNGTRTGPVYYAGTNILANTGMSATLIQKRGTNEYTLAIRSTEYQPVSKGGDHDRDVDGADLTGIFVNGLALAQLSALEKYYAWLKESGRLPQGAILDVTGYSLGGHLATVFTEIHAADSDVVFRDTTTFNAAGRGTWSGAISPGEIVAYYSAVLTDPAAAGIAQDSLSPAERGFYDLARAAAVAGTPFDPLSIYADPRHRWAQLAARLQYLLRFNSFDQGSADLRNGAAEKITQIYGKEFSPEWTGVANSGVHGPATGIFVEAQPLVEQQYVNNGGAFDFGNGHALVLIVDSLALMRAYQTLDPGLTVERLNNLFAASSNRLGQTFPTATAEDDALENALDALRRLFLGADVSPTNFKPGAKGFGNFDARGDFHNKLDELTTSTGYAQWAGQIALQELAGKPAADILDAASGDIAYRYALKELNPFVVTGAQALHEAHNSARALDLYDPQSGQRTGRTEQYLADRAAMLEFSIKANLANAKAVSSSAVTGQIRYADLRERADGSTSSVLAYLLGGTPNFNGPNTRVVAFGTAGEDALQGRDNADHLYGGDGSDYLRGGLSNDYLEGGAGLDVYQYNASTSLGLFDLNDGADIIFDSDGKGVLRYTYSPSSGSVRATVITDASVKLTDTKWRSADGKFEYQLLPGTQAQSDLVVTILGDAGGSMTLKDFRDGDFGIHLDRPSARTFADAANTITGTDLSESLAGTSAGDIVIALGGSDTVRAGDGDDSILGGDGADMLYGEAGRDRIYGEAGRDSLYGGSGDDELYGGSDADVLEGEDGSDLLSGGDGSDVIAGGPGNDEIHSGDVMPLSIALLRSETESPTGLKGEWVDGGEGDDTVIGGAGNDQVMGGGGADVLAGGAGDDNLIGDRERALVHVDNWTVTRQVTVSGSATNYQLVYNAYAQTFESTQGAGDTIYGGAGADWIFAGAGDDYADGGSGDDLVFGEAGNDVLTGGAGNDVLVGDNPGVVAAADEGDDFLDGGDGDDLLYGNGGDDILFGGPGTDTLVGGAGRDTYVFNRGDGTDAIWDTPAGADDPEASILVLGEGVQRDSIKFRPGSLVVDLGGGDSVHVAGLDRMNPASTPVLGAIRFADGTSMSFGEILAQGFDIDGTPGDDDAHDGAHPQLVGTGATDRIHGFAGNDVLFGLAGDDVLAGDAGDDTLVGDTGNDAYLFGRGDGRDLLFDYDVAAGNTDHIDFAADIGPDDIEATRDAVYPGNLVLTIRGSADSITIANQFVAPEHQVEEIRFSDGTVWTPETTPMLLRGSAGPNVLLGTSGPDYIEGLTGDDTLFGGAGNDTYRMARGDGRDFISDFDATPGNSDTIVFAGDILPAEVRATRAGNDLILALAGSADRVAVANEFENDGVTPYAVERVRFAVDGTVWDLDAIKQKVIMPTSGNDSITGYAADDWLEGLAGNDTIDGAGGDDTIVGGAGDDSLRGGAGSDLYRYAAGDGSDVVDDRGGASDMDTLRFEPGISPTAVTLRRSRFASLDDLFIDVGGGTRIRVAGQFAGGEIAGDGLERIEFEGGTVWDRAAIRAAVLAATPGADELFGFAGNDSINGLAGDDLIDGAAGNDTLRGGPGSDTVNGGLGDDTFLFDLGDGEDFVTDGYGVAGYSGGGIDSLVLGAGITPANVTASRSGNELRIQVNGTTDVVRLSQYFNDDALERIQFANGTVWTPATVAAMFPVTGTSSNDTLIGSGLPDTINALGGNDLVRGGGGNDTIDGGLGGDVLYGDAGDDLIYGGQFDTSRKAASDTIYGGDGNDILITTNANGQYLYGGNGNDIYIGGSGWAWMEDTAGNNLFVAGASSSDDIWMGDGNDLAIGGRGADFIDGDRNGNGTRGNDVIAYNKGDGDDTVYGLSVTSTVSIGGGALYSNLSLEVFSQTLTLKVGTGSIDFYGWYAAEPWITQKVGKLQIVIEGTKNYAPTSTDPMRNQKVQCFDFAGLVSAFDAARAAGKSFNVADNLAKFRLWGSDTAAIGGVVAYQYARTGTLGSLTHDQLRALIGDPAFGSAPQTISASASALMAESNVEPGVETPAATLSETNSSASTDLQRQSMPASRAAGQRTEPTAAADLPDSWFAGNPLPQSAQANAAAWRRIAHELPAYLTGETDDGLAAGYARATVVTLDPGVRIGSDPGFGVSDPALGRLRAFEGLKEGLALIG